MRQTINNLTESDEFLSGAHVLPTAGLRLRIIWQTIVQSIHEDIQPIDRQHNSQQASRPQASAAAATAAMTFKNFAHSLHKRELLTR